MSWVLCLLFFLNKADHPHEPSGALRGVGYPESWHTCKQSIQALPQGSSLWIHFQDRWPMLGAVWGCEGDKSCGPRGHWAPNLRLISTKLWPPELTRHRLTMCVETGPHQSHFLNKTHHPESKRKQPQRAPHWECRMLLEDGWGTSFLPASHSSSLSWEDLKILGFMLVNSHF